MIKPVCRFSFLGRKCTVRFLISATFVVTIFLYDYSFGGDAEAGKARYAQNCGNCHGPAGMGLASYPKIQGKEIAYLIDIKRHIVLERKIGPNSSLMIMMAQPLSDTEIENLAAYLSSAHNNN